MSAQQSGSSVEAPGGPVRAVLVGFALTLFGILAADLFTTPAIVIEPGLLENPAETTLASRTAYFVLNFVGMAAAGAVYLAYTGRGWDFVDLRLPTRREWLYTLAGTVIILGFYVASTVLITLLDLPAADTGVLEFVGDDEAMVLILIAIAFLFNSPAEEFLFRNVIQKRLYAAFSRSGAVVVASAIFALVHLPVYVVFADSTLAVAVPIVLLFGGGLILGYSYVVTENLVTPIIIHAVYNSFIWTLLYISMVYDFEEVETPVDLLVQVPGLVG